MNKLLGSKTNVFSLMVLFFLSFFFNLSLVKSGGYVGNLTNGVGYSSLGNVGEGEYQSDYVGLKIQIFKYNGNDLDSIVARKIINEDVDWNQTYFGESVTKVRSNGGLIAWSTLPSSYVDVDNQLPSGWGSVGVNGLDGWIKNSNYYNLKTILNTNFSKLKDSVKAFLSKLNKTQSLEAAEEYYIIVEPMIKIQNYYGTAYELLNTFLYNYDENSRKYLFNCSFTSRDNFCYKYSKALFSAQYGGLLYETVYIRGVNANSSAAEHELANFLLANFEGLHDCNTESFDRAEEIAYECFISKRGGRGIGVYKLSDIIDPDPDDTPANGSLKIEKKDSSTMSLIKNNPATFEIYSNSSCSGSGRIVKTDNNGEYSESLPKGEYCIREVEAPDGYIISTSTWPITINPNQLSKATFYNYLEDDPGTNLNRGALIIVKKDSNGNQIGGSNDLNAFFRLYNGFGCLSGSEYSEQIYETSYGAVTISNLEAGDYSVKEIRPPAGYKESDECHNTTVISRTGVILEVENELENSCVAEFDALPDKSNMSERIRLYEKYLKLGYDYKSLLIAGIPFGSSACKESTYTNSQLFKGCMSLFLNLDGFNETNLSSYTDTITDSDGNTFYCKSSFNLDTSYNLSPFTFGKHFGVYPFNRSGIRSAAFDNSFLAGMMIINGKQNDIISKGALETTCYGTVNNSSPNNNVRYGDYLESISLDEKVLRQTDVVVNNWNITYNANNKIYKYTQTKTRNYYLNPVYAENGTGEIVDSKCENCKLLGYGFASKLNQAPGEHFFNYDYNFGSRVENKSVEQTCQYNLTNEIIITKPGGGNPPDTGEPSLNIEFRVIDTENAFIGKDGVGRNTGLNWYTWIGDSRMSANISSGLKNGNQKSVILQKLKDADQYWYQFGFYNDGVLDMKDVDFYEYYIKNKNYETFEDETDEVGLGRYYSSTGFSENEGYNYFAEYVLEKTNNSYNKKGTGAEYKIVLTPTTIKNIRKYNETHDYDDYTLECVNGENCKSTFLDKTKTPIWNDNNLTINSELINNSL